MGWAIFLLGLFDFVVGWYIQIGAWICLPVALAWFIAALKSDAKTRKQKMERRILLVRVREMDDHYDQKYLEGEVSDLPKPIQGGP